MDPYGRGHDDAAKDRAPIFRRTKNGIEPTVDDDMSDNWSEEDREDYLAGYDDNYQC